jgi:hypothetical protein
MFLVFMFLSEPIFFGFAEFLEFLILAYSQTYKELHYAFYWELGLSNGATELTKCLCAVLNGAHQHKVTMGNGDDKAEFGVMLPTAYRHAKKASLRPSPKEMEM